MLMTYYSKYSIVYLLVHRFRSWYGPYSMDLQKFQVANWFVVHSSNRGCTLTWKQGLFGFNSEILNWTK